jgi:hypothetical protein
MRMGRRKTALGFFAFSLLFLGGCSSWPTAQPVSPVLQPLMVQASPAENATIPGSLKLGVAWLVPSDGAKTLPERTTDQLLTQIHAHFSEPGIPLNVVSVDRVNSLNLVALRLLGQQHGVTHMLVVAPTVQEIEVPEKFGFAKAGFWLGTRTESSVTLEAVALELESGSPIFKASGNGQATLEELDYGAFGEYPRIYRGINSPESGGAYYPQGAKEEFLPQEVRAVASHQALARLLFELDLIKASQTS